MEREIPKNILSSIFFPTSGSPPPSCPRFHSTSRQPCSAEGGPGLEGKMLWDVQDFLTLRRWVLRSREPAPALACSQQGLESTLGFPSE